MAQGSDTKMYVALGLLAVLGGGYYMQKKGESARAADHSIEASAEAMPEIALKEDATKKITKIVIEKPATEGEGAKPAEKFVLVKDGDQWNLAEPVKALANVKNVESLLENLTKLEIKEQVSSSKDSYAQYEVGDGKALHSTFYEGDKVDFELVDKGRGPQAQGVIAKRSFGPSE